MNRKEAKELLPIIQAFAEGKTILVQDGIDWCYLGNESDFNLNPQRYRIKPEPKYRPFANAEECWQEMQKHQPFGWIKNKINNKYYNILAIDAYGITPNLFDENPHLTYKDVILQKFLFADETPFGIKE